MKSRFKVYGLDSFFYGLELAKAVGICVRVGLDSGCGGCLGHGRVSYLHVCSFWVYFKKPSDLLVVSKRRLLLNLKALNPKNLNPQPLYLKLWLSDCCTFSLSFLKCIITRFKACFCFSHW